MSEPGARKVLLPSLVVVWAASCAVFPDEAVLPLTSNGEAGAAGESPSAQAGAGGGSSGIAGEGAAASSSGGSEMGEGGSAPLAGAPAVGGADGCATPMRATRAALADTWIESAKPATGHGNDVVLSVAPGAEERRALLSFSLPPAPEGASVVRGTLTLHLESNADVTLAERHLELSLLGQGVDESRATWNNWGNGANRRWLKPGGDHGLPLATSVIPASLAVGPVTFDVTEALADLFGTVSVPFPLIVIEAGPEPAAPAELAFSSSEGDASKIPELLIEYCP